MKSFTQLFADTTSFQQVEQSLAPHHSQLITGLAGSGRTLFLASLQKAHQTQLLIVTQNMFHGTQLMEDFSGLIPEEQLHFFPVDEVIHAEMAFASPEFRAERLATLSFLLSEKPGIVIVPLAGMRKLLPAKDDFVASFLSITQGMDLDLHELATHLIEAGYEREQMVASPGEFSIRGGIIDIYPLTEEHPVRIELFDTEVDSLRYFDADTQRSIRNINHFSIVPSTEQVFTRAQLHAAASAFETRMNKYAMALHDEADKQSLTQNLTPFLEALKKGETVDGLAPFAGLIYPKNTTILEYIRKDAVIVMDEYSRILETERHMQEEEAEWMTQQLSEHKVFPDVVLSEDVREQVKKAEHPLLYFSLFQKGMGNIKLDGIYPFQYRNMQPFFGRMPLLKTEMDRFQKLGYTVIVLAPNQERATSLKKTFREFEIQSVETDKDALVLGQTQIIMGNLVNGFELPQEKIAVLTEKELFNRVTRTKARKRQISNAERLKSYNELSPGDYVVHVNHGIGRYTGMETMEINGVHQDYLTIVYQKEARLFIPVTQLNLLQKYVSSEGKVPRVNKLGGTDWAKTKRKVETRVEDIADELIELYAARDQEKGYAFSPDDAYQKEFEDAFPYTETDDQLRSVKEIKKDMEDEKPMDRLLVGDVGYGKTEVAIRAIFKAIQDGKQSAFLVPTTVLAQQHYETLLDRFEGFPVEVGLLSRFRTKKQQAETLEKLRKGQVDVLVGTHRILSKDVQFQDLGLLVVDEEQRFGVKHKERLKQMKAEVDVLTLTATPIPRTLHMSMLGVRDLSVIETPPANRYPVQTYVMELHFGAVKEAIEREMGRNGQVFYLHNRVATIEKKVNELQALLPDARIGFAHGQMSEGQLEDVLFQFLQGTYDVLVTTTIIETGVDMPNVNTLIVEDADHMGLSQLYQLRGRVGRSNRVSYAYFMYQPDKVLTEVSEKRLQAIKDFTELGSGFKLAMRDLSIRGAGNLLGKQQHGFIDSVGFDLYSEMLSEAVSRKRGLDISKKTPVEIDLNVNAYVPATYIEDERQKIEIYKRIRELKEVEEYTELQEDLFDRFGDYPQETADLLEIGLLKMYSEQAHIEKIKREKDILYVTFSKTVPVQLPIQELFRALKDIPLHATVSPEEDRYVVIFKLNKNMQPYQWLEHLIAFTKQCAAYLETKEEANTEVVG